MITAEFNPTSVARVEKFFKKLPLAVDKALTREMRAIAIDLQSFIKAYRLSGRPGLRNVTGNLRRSIVQVVEHIPLESVSAVVGVAPNATKYARIHEFGGQIQVPAVEGRLMVFTGKDGKTVFTRKHRAFTVNMPQRSFLRISLRRNRAGFEQRISNAVKKAVASSLT